ncbi:hypothetical protein OOK27_05225 [Streptomyces canus]|uniref:hypothetical protein n=1 Tax=Streptomyces canus TaxID=58343 RepID=UPI00225B5CAB|nr:hypothetical protein [Streptomyces canus]MCX5253574.1 hypothetical protein [Streptomyces canus]
MTTNPTPEPIRKSSLPCTPPAEWEFHTWFPHPDGGGDMVPGERQRGVVVRRCISYGDWEPVRPERWADEPAGAASAVVAVAAPPTGQTAEAVQYWFDAATERREERDRLRAVVARVAQMADAWEQQLPEVIRTPAVVSAIRATLEPADDPSRLADEAQQQPDTEAHPAEHKWAAELYDPLAEEWVPGTRYADRDRALNALAHAKRVGPTWKDGTPTERRLVRTTTTYTVEPPAVVSAVPPQPEETA